MDRQNEVFYCTMCSKQYVIVAEYEAHLSSYDHHHKKRMVEMRQAEALRKQQARGGTAGEREAAKAAAEDARLAEQMRAARQAEEAAKAKQAAAAAAAPAKSSVLGPVKMTFGTKKGVKGKGKKKLGKISFG